MMLVRLMAAAAVMALSQGASALTFQEICTKPDGNIVSGCVDALTARDAEHSTFAAYARDALVEKAIAAFRTALPTADFSEEQYQGIEALGYCDQSSGEGELLGFVKGHIGRFPSEVKARPGALKLYIRDGHSTLLNGTYDDAAGVLRRFSPFIGDTYTVTEKCTGKGSYVATSIGGAKVKVRREDCIRVNVRDPNLGISTFQADIPMTPSEYRDFREGFAVVIAFSPAERVASEVATVKHYDFPPSWTNPVAQSWTEYEALGSLKRICFAVKSGTRRIAEFGR